MGSYPADKQVDSLFTEKVFTDHPMIIASYVEYDPAVPFAQQISSSKCKFDFLRFIPIRIFYDRQPIEKRPFTLRML
jgi:hypothetical protein